MRWTTRSARSPDRALIGSAPVPARSWRTGADRPPQRLEGARCAQHRSAGGDQPIDFGLAERERRRHLEQEAPLFEIGRVAQVDRNEEDLSLIHISEPTRLLSISYAVFC